MKRLVFVTGKGGTGKSTVAAALARALARRGRRVRLMTAADSEGSAALAEYLERALPGAVARRVTGSRLYRRFVEAAPGLRELMGLGKILDEARDGGFDTVIADGPATGQIVQALRMPGVARSAFGGLVRWEGERLVSELRDPARTLFLVVALPEALAVDETLELVRALEELGLGVGPLVMNRVHRAPLAAEDLPAPAPDAPPAVAAALRAGREQAGRAAIDGRFSARLRDARPPLVELPFLFGEPPDLDLLGDALGALEAA